jgi:hypothetical protein
MTKPASLPGEVLAAVKGRGEIPMPVPGAAQD